jgi:hypothetical protein
MIDGSGEPRRSPYAPAYQSRSSSPLDRTIKAALSLPERNEHAIAGRLVLAKDGRPIRSILTGRRALVTGSYASRKAGRSQVFESMTERSFFMHCEVLTKVVDYRAQPFRFEFNFGGKWRTYIADCIRLLDNGLLEVVELKSDLRDLQDHDYRGKIECVRQLCSLLGWRFRIIRRPHLQKCPIRASNIEFIQQDRLTAFDEHHVYRVMDRLADGPSTLGDLADHLGVRQSGIAILNAMMVARIIKIDLRRRHSPDSQVQLLNMEGRA